MYQSTHNKVNTRQFLRNYKQLSEKQHPTIIYKGNTPVSVLVPFSQWEKQNTQTEEKTISIDDISEYFVHGPPDASLTIDNIYK